MFLKTFPIKFDWDEEVPEKSFFYLRFHLRMSTSRNKHELNCYQICHVLSLNIPSLNRSSPNFPTRNGQRTNILSTNEKHYQDLGSDTSKTAQENPPSWKVYQLFIEFVFPKILTKFSSISGFSEFLSTAFK